jgi:hypothetical protein
MQYWRVISSAQTDGSEILFAVADGDRLTLIGRCQWLAESSGQPACWWSDDLCRAVVPTHWLPLPTLRPALQSAAAPVARMPA